jgi:DNA-binding Lrp family transcriptional regulator
MDITNLKSKIARLLNRTGTARNHKRKAAEAKSFKEHQQQEEAFDTRDLSTRTVPVDKIVGSVGRYHDFDDKFRLKDHVPHERLQNIKKVIREGRPMPPVDLYQIKDEYYVLDGNHRVSAAKEFGYDTIDARIVEFIPSKNTLENILYREKVGFSEKTGLPYAIELTEIGQYAHLALQISKHRRFLEQAQGKRISFENAALDWYKTIYLPLVGVIEKGRLIDSFRERTIADLYAYVSSHQWEKGLTRKYGTGIDQLIPKDMEEFRKKMLNKEEYEYPEMQRKITAFVLMNVSAKKEHHIMEKLYALHEVREIHSVHGDVDMLVKAVLTRDLLSSDAEIIGQFVSDRIRQIPGVISTQTLIPASSKIKENECG